MELGLGLMRLCKQLVISSERGGLEKDEDYRHYSPTISGTRFHRILVASPPCPG